MAEEPFTAEGGCSCGAVRYRVTRAPLIVHGCHCTWCQRETGGAFAINAMVEAAHVEVLSGEPVTVDTASASGKGQKIVRCPTCHVAVWSHYSGAGEKVCFVRVGTLDAPHGLQPDIHIFTSTKLPWLPLPEGVPAVTRFYKIGETWSRDSLARRAKLLEAG